MTQLHPLMNEILALPPGVYRTSEVRTALGPKVLEYYSSPSTTSSILRKLSLSDHRVRLVVQGGGRSNESHYEIIAPVKVPRSRKAAAQMMMKARIEAGMTQKALGLELGRAQADVSLYERNLRRFSQDYFNDVMKLTRGKHVVETPEAEAPVEAKTEVVIPAKKVKAVEVTEIKSVEVQPEKAKKTPPPVANIPSVLLHEQVLASNRQVLLEVNNVKTMLEAMLSALGLKLTTTLDGKLAIVDPAKL